MTSKLSKISWIVSLILLGFSSTLLLGLTSASDDGRKNYIVYMGEKLKGDLSHSSLHLNMLQDVLGSEASTCLLYSYKKSFNGFAVKLTEEEKERVAGMDGVVSVFPSEKKQLHTTRSWDFMGFPQQVNRTTIESDIVIGVFDSGIWPESESFSDKGFSPPPSKWKGTCQSSNITCNNKIIGARYYRSDGLLGVGLFGADELQSPRDSNGHGTLTASTAAGGIVGMASLMGLGLGTARGGVPAARIAVYKVCWFDGCHDADILAAFDDAIADGVDLISISIGGHRAKNYFNDSIAIGSFHAMRNGIFTSASAGNDGPDLGTIVNFSPWLLSVAASTIDRKFQTKLQLGDGSLYEGVSINTFDMKNETFPIIYAGSAPNKTANYTGFLSRFCIRNSVDANLVKGKIILCDSISNTGELALLAGAAGMVVRDISEGDGARIYPVPGVFRGEDDGASIGNYINSTSNPVATIMKSTEVKNILAPYVASFSSRGPNPITNDILSPDVTAPGVDILAAYSPLAPLSRAVPSDKRRAQYSIYSGTSLSCPHATAVAAYIKSFHPSWSPAAIKSALMTTAYPLDVSTSPDAELAYGAGHIDPLKAINPGLVYDADVNDYIKFLCGQGYSSATLQPLTGDNSSCSSATMGAVSDLNIPSFGLFTLPLQSFSRNYTRTVTNVGSSNSVYNVTVTSPQALKIRVEPTTLSFTSVGQKLSFVVKVEGVLGRSARASASLVWDDGTHKVRSPIAVYASS